MENPMQNNASGGSGAFLEPPLGMLDHPISLILGTEIVKSDPPKQLDSESNSFFVRVLQGEDMGKVVHDRLLKGNPIQKRFMDVILKTLAEEVALHLHEYPENMLTPISELYGKLLAFGPQLFSKNALSILWRAVLVALYNQQGSMNQQQSVLLGMIKIISLAKNTISQYTNLATCLINAPSFNHFPSDLIDFLDACKESVLKAVPFKVPDAPDEAISDRVFFVINNVSTSNVNEKSAELITLIDDKLIPWFVHYLVGKRISQMQELRFHPTFSAVLDNMQDKLPKLKDFVKLEVIRSIKQILKSIRPDHDDMSSRQNLKTLGNFLGLTSLAKNKPILREDLCLKELIYEAYHKGHIPVRYVIPFVASVLQHVTTSVVFQPPNPWTMAILKVLREYHSLHNAHENLRMEIEILFDNIKQSLENIQMCLYLRDQSHMQHIDQLIFTVSETPELQMPQSGMNFPAPIMANEYSNQQHVENWMNREQQMMMRMKQPKIEPMSRVSTPPTNQQVAHQPSMPYDETDRGLIQSMCNIEEQLIREQNNKDPRFIALMNLLESKPDLNMGIILAVENVLNDFCKTTSERCCKITVPTVLAMIRKDFALDPDPLRIRIAGCQMVRHLAASLALVSIRETELINSINSAVFELIMPRTGRMALTESDSEMIQSLIQNIIIRGTHICIAYIQKMVAELVMNELDRVLLERDVKHRQEMGAMRFVEASYSQISAQQNMLPEKLRLAQGKPKELDMMVYEEFRHSIPGFVPGTVPSPKCIQGALGPQAMQQRQKMAAQRANAPSVASTITPMAPPPPTTPQQPPTNPAAHNLQLFDRLLDIFDRHLSQMRSQAGVNQTDPIQQSMAQLINTIQLAKNAFQAQNLQTRAQIESASMEFATTILSAVVQSIFSHFKATSPSPRVPSRDEHTAPRGGPVDIMQHFLDAITLSLRQLQSQLSSFWITKQVTRAWIDLPDRELVDDEVTESIKWNWQAFVELLRAHVVSLPDSDAYLADCLLKGSNAATSFVMDLLENCILPQQTSLNIHMQVQASLTPTTTSHQMSLAPGANPLGPIGSNISPSTSLSAAMNNSSSGSSLYKREFVVLNEYDLWDTIKALRCRASETMTATVASVRLRVCNARIRSLLDLGLLEAPLLISNTMERNFLISGIAALYSGCSQAREFELMLDTTEASNIVNIIVRWMDVYQISPHSNSPEAEKLLTSLMETGLLSSERELTSFCRLTTQNVIEKALSHLRHTQSKTPGQLQGQVRVNAYNELDAYARLMACLIKRCGPKPGSLEYNAKEDIQTKVQILNKILGIIAGLLLQENEVRNDKFHSMPFERITIMLFLELISSSTNPPTVLPSAASPDSDAKKKSLDSIAYMTQNVLVTFQQQLPLSFGHLLHILRPEKATLFVFSWLELLSHRHFIGRTLNASNKAVYHPMYAQLLVDLLKYLAFFLQNALLPKPIQHLYKSTLKLFIVLIHDFPEFVCSYYSLFCDVLPPNTVQMRNLILSALPVRNMIVSNPLQAPQLDQNQMSDMNDPTGHCLSAGSRLPGHLKRGIDRYIVTREPSQMLADLGSKLVLIDNEQLMQKVILHQKKLQPQPQPSELQIESSVLDDAPAEQQTGYAAVAARKLSTDATQMAESDQCSVASDSSSTPTAKKRGQKKNLMEEFDGDATSQIDLDMEILDEVNVLWSVRTVQQFATFGQADCMRYNIELITNLVLYLGLTAIENLRSHHLPLNMEMIANQPQMDILHGLVLSLDNEGRYLLLNCMANQLRYPNWHTYYFSYAILHLFAHQTATESVKEQISRVLIERLIVSKPHPWGLLLTSAELLRNKSYEFWDHDFARSHQDIANLLLTVAKSCQGMSTMNSTGSSEMLGKASFLSPNLPGAGGAFRPVASGKQPTPSNILE